MSLSVVALYDSLGADAVEYIVNHAECVVAVSSKTKLPIVLAACAKCPHVKHIVQFDAVPEYNNPTETVAEADKKTAGSIQLLGLSELKAKGKALGGELNIPSPETTAFIMYTSGTT